MRSKSALLVCAAAAVLSAGIARAEDVWLKNPATVRSDHSPAGATVVELRQGDKVQKLETQGSWVKIQVNGKTGWVAADSISIRPVKPDTGLFGAQADARSSSAAAFKPLTPLATDFAQSQHLSETGLNQMKQTQASVTPQMLQDFMAAGHVGTAAALAARPAPVR